jgi:methionyl-tRNA formyltransferase
MAETPAWWSKPRNVSICVDTPGWFDNFAADLTEQISARGDHAIFVRNAAEVQEGGIAFYLSCMRLTPPDVLARNVQNIVVHASALPAGRGFSPIVWQVLEGKNVIPINMILAADEADSGDILMRDEIVLDGGELNDEIRDRLGHKIIDVCLAYLDAPEASVGYPQQGEPSWYERRRPEDSRLDPERTIAEQFDLLRVVDNERYPAFFDYRGRRFVLRITAEEGEQ